MRLHFQFAAAALCAVLSAAAVQAADAPTVTLGKTPDGAQMMDAKIDPAGTIHLLLQKNNAPFYAVSKDNGKTASAPIPVITQPISIPGLEFLCWDMSVSDKGKVFVVSGNNAWKLKNVPADMHGMFLSTLEPNAKAFSLTRPLNGEPSEGFSIVAGKDGNVTAAYLKGKLYWKHSTDGGKTFTPNQEINTDYLPCNCCTTSVAYGADGTLAVLYREAAGNRRDIWAVLVKDGKQTHVPISKTLWEINGCPMTYYKVTPTADGFLAAWPTRGQAYFTRFSSSGKIWAPGEIKVGGKTAMRSSLFALPGKNDSTLVAWKSEDKLHWKIYDSAGQQLGEESQAASPGPQAGGVATSDGNFILFP